jgi:hypothetical protein
MARFIAVVELSPTGVEDLAGSRQRFELARRYLARRGIRLDLTFRLDGGHHLLVLESPESPTRMLNRALARAWPEPAERPGHARLVNADRWPDAMSLHAQPGPGSPATAAHTAQVAGDAALPG